MHTSSLVISEARLSARVVDTRHYEFSPMERTALDLDLVKEYRRVVLATFGQPVEPPNVRGLATRFASLKNWHDVDAFARRYGLLGVQVESGSLLDVVSGAPAYDLTFWEPLEIWAHHVETVRRIMRLYRALAKRRRGGDVEIIGQHLRVDYEASSPRLGIVRWHDGSGLELCTIRELDELDEGALGFTFLAHAIRSNLHGGIYVDFSRVVPAKDATLGYRIAQQLSTRHLLAAIYYDLWQLITEERPVITCKYCGLPLEKTGRREYCRDACKQAYYRRRKGGSANGGKSREER